MWPSISRRMWMISKAACSLWPMFLQTDRSVWSRLDAVYSFVVMLKGGVLKDTWAPFKASLKSVRALSGTRCLLNLRDNAWCSLELLTQWSLAHRRKLSSWRICRLKSRFIHEPFCSFCSILSVSLASKLPAIHPAWRIWAIHATWTPRFNACAQSANWKNRFRSISSLVILLLRVCIHCCTQDSFSFSHTIAQMICAARDLWRQLDSSRAPVAPQEIWQQLRANFARFDEQVVR